MALATLGDLLRKIKTYLTCSNLLGNPLANSVWAYLWSACNVWAFVTTMDVDVQTFQITLWHFSKEWCLETITQANVKPDGKPQIAHCSLDVAGCLPLVLHWLSSTMPAIPLQLSFAITPSICSLYL